MTLDAPTDCVSRCLIAMVACLAVCTLPYSVHRMSHRTNFSPPRSPVTALLRLRTRCGSARTGQKGPHSCGGARAVARVRHANPTAHAESDAPTIDASAGTQRWLLRHRPRSRCLPVRWPLHPCEYPRAQLLCSPSSGDAQPPLHASTVACCGCYCGGGESRADVIKAARGGPVLTAATAAVAVAAAAAATADR